MGNGEQGYLELAGEDLRAHTHALLCTCRMELDGEQKLTVRSDSQLSVGIGSSRDDPAQLVFALAGVGYCCRVSKTDK